MPAPDDNGKRAAAITGHLLILSFAAASLALLVWGVGQVCAALSAFIAATGGMP